MAGQDDELTPEELRQAERLFEERLRAASQEQYRRMVAARDPALYRGPVRLPREVVQQLREEVAAELRARRTAPPAPPPGRRWPWQRR